MGQNVRFLGHRNRSGAWQGHGEGAAGALVAFRADQAAVPAHDPLGEREPEAGALVAGIEAGAAAERLEDRVLLALGDPDAGVDDVEADPVAVLGGEAADRDDRLIADAGVLLRGARPAPPPGAERR